MICIHILFLTVTLSLRLYISFYVATNYLPLSITGSISRPGSLVLLILLERIFLGASITPTKIVAVFLCINGIICTIQPWTHVTNVEILRHRSCMHGSYLNDTEINLLQENSSAKAVELNFTKCKTEPLNDPVNGYTSVTANVLLTVGLLLYQRHKLTQVASANALFWSWIIGAAVSGLIALIFEKNKLYVYWNVYRVTVVLMHGFAAGLLTVLVFAANNITSSLLVQLASSLQLVFMLIGQYTVLVDINPGHYNLLEVAGVVTIVLGSFLVPLYSLITNTSSKE